MENSAGYLKLMESVKRDCAEGENCFNPNGCDKTGRVKCFHRLGTAKGVFLKC